MRLRTLGWSALILLPLLVCAGHLHARRGANPESLREMTRCLSIVRVAASRRKGNQDQHERERHGTAGVRTDAAAMTLTSQDLAKPA